MVIGIDASRAFGTAKTGTENYSYSLIKHLLRLPENSGHNFVLFIRPNAQIPHWTRQKNVTIKLINLKFLWTQVGLAWETWHQFVYPYIRTSVKKGPTDRRGHGRTGLRYLDVLWIPAHTLPVWRRPGLKTVVTIHGLEYQWLPEYNSWLQRWYLPLSTFYAAKSATKLIAVSKFTQKQLEKELHTNAKKIKVIYEGVEKTRKSVNSYTRKAVIANYGLKSNKYILFVGTIQPRKNLVALVEAFSLVAELIPGYQLVIAGSVGWMAEEVLQAPGRLGIQDRVIFTGRVTDEALSVLYLGASLYVQPSWTEGFGLPVLEAMAAGVPVVTSDGGALPEVVGGAGKVVPLGSNFVAKLAEAIRSVVIAKKRQHTLITSGYKRIKEFSWDRAAKETLLYLTG